MNNVANVRFWLVLTFTGFVISAGYELREAGHSFGGVPSYAVAVLSLLISSTLAKTVVDIIIRSRWVRGRLAASAHVEGYWYLQTSKVGDSPLNRDGILFIHTDPFTNETKVVTTRLDDNGEEFPTVSEIAYVKGGNDTSYLNYFRPTYPGPQPKFGLASGRFVVSDDFKPYPTFLEAHIVLTGEDIVRRQSAVRIDDRFVKDLQIKFGARWKTEILKSGKRAIMAPPESAQPPLPSDVPAAEATPLRQGRG